MPPVYDLDCTGRAFAHGFGIPSGTITTHNFDAGPLTKPLADAFNRPLGEEVDWTPGCSVNADRSIRLAGVQRPTVNADHARRGVGGQRHASHKRQEGVTTSWPSNVLCEPTSRASCAATPLWTRD